MCIHANTNVADYNAATTRAVQTEQGATNLAIEKAKLSEINIRALEQVASLMAAMAQGALAASAVSVGTDTSYGLNYSYDRNYSYTCDTTC